MADDFGDPRALAVASYLITFGLLAQMRGRGILQDQEISELLDNAMLMLEQSGLADAPIKAAAHEILKNTKLIADSGYAPPKFP